MQTKPRAIQMTALIDPSDSEITADFDKDGVSLSWEIGNNDRRCLTLSYDELDALIDERLRFRRLQEMAAEPVGIEDLPRNRTAAE